MTVDGLKKSIRSCIILLALIVVCFPIRSVAGLTDSDSDELSDIDEVQIYHTDPYNPDHDGDGYVDGQEVKNGYSPHAKGATQLIGHDYDKDGLNDGLELAFGANLASMDSDGDGMTDGQEVGQGRDPVVSGVGSLKKHIEVSLKHQKLQYFLGRVVVGEMSVSTGKISSPTPRGVFAIMNKSTRAWSKPARLWMPYWMSFVPSGKYGLHELPEWPDGRKEGQNHLGLAVSGGCVRLGMKDAKILYDWTPVGTQVVIKD